MLKPLGGNGGGGGGSGSISNASEDEDEVMLTVTPGAGGQVPWSKCIFGCNLKPRRKVALLPCMHVVCSQVCATRVVSKAQAGSAAGPSAEALKCELCQFTVTREQLSNFADWVDPEKEFPGRSLTPVVMSTPVCGFCTHRSPATAYCKGCAAFLCFDCVNLHPQLKSTEGHVVQLDLEEAKRQVVACGCRHHLGKKLSHYCLTCEDRLCGECLGAHDRTHQNKMVDIEVGKLKLVEKIRLARKVMNCSEAAITQLSKQRLEVLPGELENVLEERETRWRLIGEMLTKRHSEMPEETRQMYESQMVKLQDKEKAAEESKAAARHFLHTAELMMSKMDDVQTINFLIRSEPYLQSLSELERKISFNYNGFVEQDHHLRLSSSTDPAEAMKAIEKFFRVEYKGSAAQGQPLSLLRQQQQSPVVSLVSESPTNASIEDMDSMGSSRSRVGIKGPPEVVGPPLEWSMEVEDEETRPNGDDSDIEVVAEIPATPREEADRDGFKIVYEYIVLSKKAPGPRMAASPAIESSVEEIPTSSGQAAAAAVNVEGEGSSNPGGEASVAEEEEVNEVSPSERTTDVPAAAAATPTLPVIVMAMNQQPPLNNLIPIIPPEKISSLATGPLATLRTPNIGLGMRGRKRLNLSKGGLRWISQNKRTRKRKRSILPAGPQQSMKPTRKLPSPRQEGGDEGELEKQGNSRSGLETKDGKGDTGESEDEAGPGEELGSCFEYETDGGNIAGGPGRRRSCRIKDVYKGQERSYYYPHHMDYDFDEDLDFGRAGKVGRRGGRKRKSDRIDDDSEQDEQ